MTSKQAADELEVDEVMDEPEAAIEYDIAAYPSDLTLSVLYEMWTNGDIIIPDYQRNFVWNIKQSSLLIDSFLLGLPVPQVFLYVDENNKSQVIDGQQRILSVVYFLDGLFGDENIHGKKQVFRLQGLPESSPYYKLRFKDLSTSHQRRLKGAVLRAINIRQLNPKGTPTSVYHIFERLNTGGTPLRPQEIRNVVFRGDFVKFLRKLNENANWRKILGRKTLERHQKDLELLLRIFGFAYYFKQYEKPMKEFLNRVMSGEPKEGLSAQAMDFEKRFAKATELVIDTLGDKPFHARGPLNSSILDAVLATVITAGKELPKDFLKRYRTLVADKEFIQATYYSTSDLTVVNHRFGLARKYLLG